MWNKVQNVYVAYTVSEIRKNIKHVSMYIYTIHIIHTHNIYVAHVDIHACNSNRATV